MNRLDVTARNIAEVMGWQVEERGVHSCVVGPGGEAFYLRYASSERFEVHPWYPKTLTGHKLSNGDDDRIIATFGIRRHPFDAAAHIMRTFLPKYRQALARVLERKAEQDALILTWRAGLARIAEAAKSAPSSEEVDISGPGDEDTRWDANFSEAYPYGRGFCDIDINNVPVDLAVKIAALLRKERESCTFLPKD